MQDGDKFVCQNCGNVFSTDQVGAERGGCNPANLEEMEMDEDTVTIPASYLDQYAGNFADWEGPVE